MPHFVPGLIETTANPAGSLAGYLAPLAQVPPAGDWNWKVFLISIGAMGVYLLIAKWIKETEEYETKYGRLEGELPEDCLACGEQVEDRLESACEQCGFDPTDPESEEIERALEQFETVESVEEDLDSAFEPGIRNLLEVVDKLEELEFLDADALPRAELESRHSNDNLGPLKEKCHRQVGRAKNELKDRIRELTTDASSDTDETPRSETETHAW